jgi:dynein light intermediate chain, axonemal
MDINDPFKRSFGSKFNFFETVNNRPYLDSKRQGQLAPMENKPKQEDVLNAILQPREWVENGKHYMQYVSHQQATRVDVAKLREMLDQKLMERQARESGICPVREELFAQCFDEIIR